MDGDKAATALSPMSLSVALQILVNGPQSRVQLADRMSLSPPSLTRLVKPLLAGGILTEGATVRASSRGRSSMLLDVVDDYRFIGVKVTGEAAYGVLTDVRARVLATAEATLPAAEAGAVVQCVSDLVSELNPRGVRVDGIGVTVGGKVSQGRVVDSRYLHWTDVGLLDELISSLDAPVRLENDVVGLTRAEHWFGWGRGLTDFALLTIGAGIGYGLVLADTFVPIETGPVGHLPIHPSGPVCFAGHRGCLTSYASAASLTAAVSVGHRTTLDLESVLDLVRTGDTIAVRAAEEAAWAVGRAAATIADVTSVARVILSGEAVAVVELARDAFDRGLDEYRPVGAPPVDVVVQSADFFEWARGAAAVAIHAQFPQRARGVGGSRESV